MWGAVGIRERLDRAAEMPHRKLAGDNRLDARLESKLGRLFFEGAITKNEYEAGVRYSEIALNYLSSIDAPDPYGSELGPMWDDACFHRKIMFASAKKVLKMAGSRCDVAVDRVAVYDEAPRGDCELSALRSGLMALAGI